MEFAENLALDHKYDKELGHRLKESPGNGGYHYLNAKQINVVDEEDEDEAIPPWEKFLSAPDRAESDPRFKVGFSRCATKKRKNSSLEQQYF